MRLSSLVSRVAATLAATLMAVPFGLGSASADEPPLSLLPDAVTVTVANAVVGKVPTVSVVGLDS